VRTLGVGVGVGMVRRVDVERAVKVVVEVEDPEAGHKREPRCATEQRRVSKRCATARHTEDTAGTHLPLCAARTGLSRIFFAFAFGDAGAAAAACGASVTDFTSSIWTSDGSSGTSGIGMSSSADSAPPSGARRPRTSPS
jgi:hypothetical protein